MNNIGTTMRSLVKQNNSWHGKNNFHDLTSLISFSIFVSDFVNVLKEYKQIGDLQSSSTLYMAVDKLP